RDSRHGSLRRDSGSGLRFALGWRNDDRLAAGFLDLGDRALREAMGGHRELLVHVALPEDLDDVETAANAAAFWQDGRAHVGAIRECLELSDVDLRHDVGVRVAKAALRQAPLDRRLAALEVLLVDVALRARLLALLPAAGGFSDARADA